MKADSQTMDVAFWIALSLDSVLFSAGMLDSLGHLQKNLPTPMEIGNLEQRKQDRENNASFPATRLAADHGSVGKEILMVPLLAIPTPTLDPEALDYWRKTRRFTEKKCLRSGWTGIECYKKS